MRLSDTAGKWMAVDVIIWIICVILWALSDDGRDVYGMLIIISALAAPIILFVDFVTTSKEEREKRRKE